MTKRLASSTIVDPAIYVDRPADRQLDNSIDEMGRPPYVLVARQMGKTNLLINMKRRREAAGDAVAYFDLSVRYESPRSFFRSVIDGVLESVNNPHGYDRNDIDSIRRIGLEATIEYERSLRAILSRLNQQRLVLVFDEVDSLIKVQYSDIIFAHVRSIYFQRINHQEYWKLTYVLSGVADPSTLIKDRNISPFNIGEKVFLTDFTIDEYRSLLNNCGLSLHDDLLREIYRTTGGHPRMLWDVTSRVEDIVLGGGVPTTADINRIIHSLYLSRFDTPPVDHIRTLVEEDYQLRSAVVALRAGEVVDASSRMKLYLAGICSADDSSSTSIKNPIIDAALPADWLAGLPAPEDAILAAARDAFAQEKYVLVVDILTPYQSADLVKTNARSRQQLAFSLFFLNRSAEAIPMLLELAEDAAVGPEIREVASYYAGIGLQRVGQYEESEGPLRTVLARKGRSAVLARVALMTSLIMLNRLSDAEGVGEVDIAGDLEATDDGPPLLTAFRFNWGRIAELRGDAYQARNSYISALEIAPSNMVPGVELQLAGISPNRGERMHWLTSAARHIIDGHLPIAVSAYFDLSLQPRHLLRCLDGLLRIRAASEFDRLLEYATSTYGTVEDTKLTYLLRLIKGSPEEGEQALSYLTRQATLATDTPPDKVLDALRLASQYASVSDRQIAAEAHSTIAVQLIHESHAVRPEDLLFMLTRSAGLIQKGLYASALRIIDAVSLVLTERTEENAILFLVLRTHEMVVSRHLSDRERSLSRPLKKGLVLAA